MVINEKALVRELKEAYKGVGYTVMVLPGDHWVFKRPDAWTVEIEGRNNVPNEVLALVVLHMGYLPTAESCYRIYKGKKCSIIQMEIYKNVEKSYRTMEDKRAETDGEPIEIRRTSLVYGRRRVWQQRSDKYIMLIDPAFEGLMSPGGDNMIRRVGENIYVEGEISCVFISRAIGGANESIIEHLSQVNWT